MQDTSSLFRENRLANLLMQASPVAIVLTDTQGIIDAANQVALMWFGYEESELAGESIGKLFSNEQANNETSDDSAQRTCVLSRMGQTETGQPWHLWGVRKNGTSFPAKVSTYSLENNELEIFIASVADLSDTHLRFEERIQGERMAAIRQLVSGLAHESRNAFQRAQSCLDLLELDLADQSDHLHLTESIRAALSDVHKNYEEAKSYAAPIKLKRTLVNLSELCQQAFHELARKENGSSLSLSIVCDIACESVKLDRTRISEVLHHVLENAWHASPPNTTIDCHCQRLQRAGADSIEITVRDHGDGLNELTQSQMFHPFFTTKTRGTGLGLAVCQRNVESHGGTISAANHRAGGTIVRITLPIRFPSWNGELHSGQRPLSMQHCAKPEEVE